MSPIVQKRVPASKLPIAYRAIRIAAFLYGTFAYAVSSFAFVYAIGFVSGIAVPKAINSGDVRSVATAVAIDLTLLSIFALQHSGMARRVYKAAFARFASPVIERSTYVLSTGLVLLLLFWQWSPIPGTVWAISNPLVANIVLRVGFFGWLMAFYSTFLISHFELFGLKQVFDHFCNRAAAPAKFATPGLYRIVRHPIYVGSLIAFWSTPVMSAGHLLFAVAMTVYILVYLEERDLIAVFGVEYRRYREKVGMLFPKL